MTPKDALNNLVRVAEVALLNGPDRRIINESIVVLNALVEKPDEPAAPKPDGA